MYYFFKTINEKGRNRLRALSGQTLEDGTRVNPTWNVQADKDIRNEYPIGTTFISARLARATEFYSAGAIKPIGLLDSEYKNASHIPTPEEKDAYSIFIGTDFMEEPVEPEKEVTKKVTYLSKLKRNKSFTLPTIRKDNFFVPEEIWYLLVRNTLNQVNTMLLGPTGTGKTEIITLLANKLGLTCSVYDMGSMYDPVAGLLGVHRLKRGGESVFDYAKFTEDISKPGIIVLDELSRAPVTTNNILFPCLDSRRNLPVEIAGGEDLRRVSVHPDCTFIATANVGSEYTGTMAMDKALLNRFFPLELDYLPVNVEKELLCERSGILSGAAHLIVSVANSIRTLAKKQEISSSISTRETIMVADLVRDGWGTLEAMEMVFLPLFEGDRSSGERSIIVKTLMAK